jgi:hypothetical protein
MFHALTMFLGLVMWAFIFVMLAPKAYRFAMAHKDTVIERLRSVRNALQKQP